MSVYRSRKYSFPLLQYSPEHDFRKEYKGSVLEKMHKRENSKWMSMKKKVCDWKRQIFVKTVEEKELDQPGCSITEVLPNEILVEILKNLDESSIWNCRAVCKKTKVLIDQVKDCQRELKERKVDRLVISGCKKGYELRCINYSTQTSRTISITNTQMKNGVDLTFAFRQLQIRRICFKQLASGTFTDSLIFFLRYHLAFCQTPPTQLSLSHVDFTGTSVLTMYHLLAGLGKNLETFEMENISNICGDYLTDAHIALLDLTKIRRIIVDGIKLQKKKGFIRIGELSLKKLAEVGNFPTLILDRCELDTQTICDYSEAWLKSVRSTEQSTVRSQLCTIKNCRQMSGKSIEVECEGRGLQYRQHLKAPHLTVYNIHTHQGRNEFTVAIDRSSEEINEKK